MAHKNWTLVAAGIGSGVVFLDSSIVTVALPKIGQELPAAPLGVLEAQSYVFNSYLLTLSALLILAGALCDYYGRRRTFAIGLAGFGIASALCGVAPTMLTLILARALQGAVGALLVPGSLALLNATFQGEERGRAFGIWAGLSGATTILGPFVGGTLVDSLSWRAAFLINVPLVLFGLLITMRYVAESRDEHATGRLDWLGAAVGAIAIGGLAVGAISGQQREWRDPVAFVALGIGAVALVIFPFLMMRRPDPLVPPELFKSRNFTVTNLATLVLYGALYVSFYYTPLFLQGTLGYTAAAGGLALMPGSLFMIFFSTRFGALAERFGPRRFMAAGPVIMALGLLWYARLPADSMPWQARPGDPATLIPPGGYFVDVLPGVLLFGMGLMMMVAPLTTALMSSVPEEHSGLASAINNAISRIGPQLVGALVFVAITASFYQSLAAQAPAIDVSQPDVRAHVSPLNPPPDDLPPDLAEAVRRASAMAYHLAMVVSAGMLLLGAGISAVGISDRQLTASNAPAVPPG
ncbi:MAG: hypothetical protein QOF51_3287 [Chloroflexota bacterium]|jgi:EmrB/QacA subfamily drug resistance transporter|nr:hypothetical protein [Chloroflexota bacterium]